MDEEKSNPSIGDQNASDAPVKRKRGRPPRVKTAELADAAQADATEAPKKRRGRPPKAKPADVVQGSKSEVRDGADWAGAAGNSANYAEDRGFEAAETGEADAGAANPETELFVHRGNTDDFAYNRSQSDEQETFDEDGAGEYSANGRREEDSDEIPQYFSTTDEDLNPDSYASVADEEDRPNRRGEDYSEAEAARPPQQEGRWHRQNPRQQRGQQRQNPRAQGGRDFQPGQRQDWREGRGAGQPWQQNRFQRGQRPQGLQSLRGQQRQNPRMQQNAQRNGQNQAAQKAQQRPNVRGQQPQQRLKNPRGQKIQISGVYEDAMNPAGLPDWNVLKSAASISDWLADVFFGIKKDNGVNTTSPTGEVACTLADSASEAKPEVLPLQEQPDAGAAESGGNETTKLSADASAIQEADSVPEATGDICASDGNRSEKGEENSEAEPSDAPSGELPQKAETHPEESTGYDPETADIFKISGELLIGSEGGFDEIYALSPKQMQEKFDELGVEYSRGSDKGDLARAYFDFAKSRGKLVKVSGILDVFENGYGGAVTYVCDNYKLRGACVYVPQHTISKYRLQRGHEVCVLAAMPRDCDATGSNCPVAVKLVSVAGANPAELANLVTFSELTPYYPTKRMIMEAPECAKWDNLSMRAVDLLTPIGRGQRALIVAPPRTGKTVLMQGMAKSIQLNSPDAHLIILLVDERPEEVTDFKRNVDCEVISSTFDEDAHSHVHAAEMVISKARRMVEAGKDVVILLDSITRLARAYNALMPNGGRTMTGGVDASALQKPKRFFGSARNIEGGGSLTIIGTALIETGSKMDEVIFEEFKGTGNLELHLDRQLSDKRIFPAINIEKSGTRKEELLYHPDEMKKIYALRRAMKGVPGTEAMEMLIQRLKKVKTNVEFLMGLNS